MQTIVANQTANGSSSTIQVTGPCIVTVGAASVFSGAVLTVETYPTDTDAEFVASGQDGHLRAPGNVFINGVGGYFLRVTVANAGDNTDITAVANN